MDNNTKESTGCTVYTEYRLSVTPEPVFVNGYGAQESIPRVVVPARQAGNRFLGSLKGVQIRAQRTLWFITGITEHSEKSRFVLAENYGFRFLSENSITKD